jgi:hypothetical protein
MAERRRSRKSQRRTGETVFLVAVGICGLATGAYIAQFFLPLRQHPVGERIVLVQGAADKVFTFSASEVKEGTLKSGWHTPDKSGVWSKQPTSELLLEVGPTYSSMRVIARLRSFVSQHVRVTANGVEIAKWRLRTKFATHKATVPRNLLRGGQIALAFVAEQVASPKQVGKGSDGREIGIRLSNLILEPCRQQCSN